MVGLIDVVGLYIIFNAKKLINVMGDTHIKILAIGLGWAAAELMAGNFLNIIF